MQVIKQTLTERNYPKVFWCRSSANRVVTRISVKVLRLLDTTGWTALYHSVLHTLTGWK